VIPSARHLQAGQIVRILSGEFEDFRGVVREAENGRVAVDVTVFGRLRPVVLDRDDVIVDGEVPEGWSQS
jgi:transcription antitermination factor NusG